MLFNSLDYLIFFPIVVIIYYLMPYKRRWLLLLSASYFFYMSWKPAYIILILTSTLIDYTAGILIGKASKKHIKRRYLFVSLFTNLGLLFVFKYFNFFSYSLTNLFMQFNINYEPMFLDIILPVGISFYTFQTISYTIDVYKGIKEPEKNFGIFALYVSFFPQLVAGPIERSGHLISELSKKVDFDYEQVTLGLKRMVWGFFKKVVIADRLAVLVDYTYSQPGQYSGLALFVATIFFGIQIYCDFSGYSDIAIGSAQILGIRLMDNFNTPYLAKSIKEFWNRWHISLSIWFRDYVYFPLGGSRVRRSRHYMNLAIVFLLSGLWHGANWTFVIWGALHGLLIIVESILTPFTNRFERSLKIIWIKRFYYLFRTLFTFLLVNFTWIFFRANHLEDAHTVIKKILLEFSVSKEQFMLVVNNLGLNRTEFMIAILGIILLLIVEIIDYTKKGYLAFLSKQKPAIRWLAYYLITTITIWLAYTGSSQFVYFQF